jgi:hypothetical protein
MTPTTAGPVDYAAALRYVQARAEALGAGFSGAYPRALYDALKGSLPILSAHCDWLRRPGQARAQRQLVAQCEELLVAVAAALHTREAQDEECAIAEARRLCRLLGELRQTLGLYQLEDQWPRRSDKTGPSSDSK